MWRHKRQGALMAGQQDIGMPVLIEHEGRLEVYGAELTICRQEYSCLYSQNHLWRQSHICPFGGGLSARDRVS